MTSDDYDTVRTKDEEWLTKEQLGFFIATSEDLFSTLYKMKLIRLIEEFLEIMKPEQADLFRYKENANTYYYKKFDKKRYEEFKNHFLNFKDDDDTLVYEIDIKKGCGKESTIGKFRIYICLDGLIKKFRKKGKQGGAHEICIYIPKDKKKATQTLILIKKYYSTLRSHYGYINPVLAYNIVPVESSWVLAEYIKQKPEGILDMPVELDMPQFQEQVNSVQWGNFLSEKHINALDGKKRIKEELKEFIIEDIEPNSLFIRMPFDIPLEQDQKAVKYYRKLAKFFEPLYTKKWLFRIYLTEGEAYFRRFLLNKEERAHEVNKATQFWKEKLEPIMKKMEGKK